VFLSQGRRETQKTMVRAALLHVLKIGGLINRVMEVQQNCEIRVYELPTPPMPADDPANGTSSSESS
jgi:hypothetical protein